MNRNQPSLDDVVNNPRRPPQPLAKAFSLNPFTWNSKKHFKAFFFLEMVYSVVVLILSVFIYFYRPVDVIYTCIYTASNAIMTFVIYKIYRGSANQGEVLFNYYILKAALSVLIVGWSIYQLVTFSRISLRLVVSLSRIFKFQFIFYILVIIYSAVSGGFAVFVVVIQFPKRLTKEYEKALSLREQSNLDRIIKSFAWDDRVEGEEGTAR